MSEAVAAMLEFVRDHEELRRHVNDAAIAEQLPIIERAQWLEKCAKVTEARAKMKVADALSAR